MKRYFLILFQGASINAKMRAVLVNWLAEVHEQFKLLQVKLCLFGRESGSKVAPDKVRLMLRC
jgi:hypothetical protein